MTNKDRAYLRSAAAGLAPVFQVGKASLTPEFTEAVNDALNSRELIKLTVLKSCEDEPKELAQMIAARTHSQVIQVIGRKIVLYKRSSKNPKILA